MLYLPPAFAHDGVAVDLCMTYSIGFRAPVTNELAVAFLDWLRDRLALDGRYADPDLRPTREPARIDPAMQRRCAAMLAAIRWSPADVDRFLGALLSEPKPSVYFTPPMHAMSPRTFLARAARSGVRLDPRTQLLYDARCLYINGEALPRPAAGGATLRRLANTRALAGRAITSASADALSLMYDWHRHGYLHTDAA
jgi:50S ribosomal protein L16 3-hydroxylase